MRHYVNPHIVHHTLHQGTAYRSCIIAPAKRTQRGDLCNKLFRTDDRFPIRVRHMAIKRNGAVARKSR